MFSLYKRNVTVNNRLRINRPSPTISRKKRIYKIDTKRIFLFTFFLRRRISASMTIEASLVLPLFLFFFLHLMSSIEMMRLHSKIGFYLWDIGNQISIMGILVENMEGELMVDGITRFYIENQLKKKLGEEYLEQSPLALGSRGINVIATNYDEKKEEFDLVVSYQVKPKITIFPFPYIRLINRVYIKAWTGYVLEIPEEKQYVYVAKYGTVWHKTKMCTYLDINVIELNLIEVAATYRACILCKGNPMNEKVYITKTGESFHTTKACSALMRTIYVVLWNESLALKPCSRCAAK